MDGLPLALDQAGAYILETGCSFSSYREQYVRQHAELLRGGASGSSAMRRRLLRPSRWLLSGLKGLTR